MALRGCDRKLTSTSPFTQASIKLRVLSQLCPGVESCLVLDMLMNRQHALIPEIPLFLLASDFYPVALQRRVTPAASARFDVMFWSAAHVLVRIANLTRPTALFA